jgi:hypothetical protein
MGEDGEQNTIHGSDVLKGAHRAGASPHFAESTLDGIGNRYEDVGADVPAAVFGSWRMV